MVNENISVSILNILKTNYKNTNKLIKKYREFAGGGHSFEWVIGLVSSFMIILNL